MKQYQQGDVLIWECEIPQNAGLVGHRVVARGEATGHAHVLEGDVELYEREGVLYCRVGDGGGAIVHEEHRTVPLNPNTSFRFGIVQEYDYDKEESRKVVD